MDCLFIFIFEFFSFLETSDLFSGISGISFCVLPTSLLKGHGNFSYLHFPTRDQNKIPTASSKHEETYGQLDAKQTNPNQCCQLDAQKY
jgi:hypothetical protein